MRFSHCIVLGLIACILGCADSTEPTKVTMWHQMMVGERVVLGELIEQFNREHPDIQVRALYKETEELRSGFQAAALAGTGPELVFGPSDSLGAFVAMGIVQDMRPWFDASQQAEFIDQALTFLPSRENPADPMLVQIGDRVGNHLALVYNRNLIKSPPQNDGRNDRDGGCRDD